MPFSPGDRPDPGVKPAPPALAGGFFTTEPPGKPRRKLLFSRSVLSNSCGPRTAAHQAYLSITNHRSLLKLMSIASLMPSNHLIFCPLFPPSIFPSIGVILNDSALPIRWPKYGNFSFKIIHFKEHSGLISFRMDWLDLLAVQGTLKSLLIHA